MCPPLPLNRSAPAWKLQETASCSNQQVKDEDRWSLFYSNSTNMAAQVLSFLLHFHSEVNREMYSVIFLESSSCYLEISLQLAQFSRTFHFIIVFILSQADDSKNVGLEAFSRIAPACTVIADVITVHNLFDVLTLSSGNKLHFPIYDKYLRSLEK